MLDVLTEAYGKDPSRSNHYSDNFKSEVCLFDYNKSRRVY